jgi:hypothetical protein
VGERADGPLEVRGGHAGHLVHREQDPAARRADLARRVAAKVRKGYVAVGRVGIDDAGRPVAAIDPPPRASLRPRSLVPRIDLAALDTGTADYWF